MKLYDTPAGFVSNNKYELASEAAVRKGKTASIDGNYMIMDTVHMGLLLYK